LFAASLTAATGPISSGPREAETDVPADHLRRLRVGIFRQPALVREGKLSVFEP